MKSSIKIPFKDPLHPNDTETQTYGCRANNPDICKNYMLDTVCAFCREDQICVTPSRSWKKQYIKMKEEGCNAD